MSLLLNKMTATAKTAQDCDDPERREDLHQLTRYLVLLEENQKSSRFVPNDAMLALDMAGFMRNRLCGGRAAPSLSLQRMALALVQTSPDAPAQ